MPKVTQDGVVQTYRKLNSNLNNNETVAIFKRGIGLKMVSNPGAEVFMKNYDEVTVLVFPTTSVLPKLDNGIQYHNYQQYDVKPKIIDQFDIANQGIDWKEENWAFSCDFHGNDLSQASIRGEDCG